MTDTRQVLEEAWEHLCQTSLSFRRYACTTIPGGDGWTMTGKFCRFLDAEAWTDAALMLIDKTRWRILSLHETEVQGNPPFEVRMGQRDAGFGRGRVVYGTGDTEALALAQASLRAKEAGDV